MKDTSLTSRGHVIRLDPTRKQANLLLRAAGVARFTYNWALNEWQTWYKKGQKPTALRLKKHFNGIKEEQFPWIMESPKNANDNPFRDLGTAFSNFFASCAGTRKGPRVGYPRFKKRGHHDSFYVANDRFKVGKRGKNDRRGYVRLPVIGDVRMMEALRFEGRILSARVYRKADRWYIAINVELDAQTPWVHPHEVAGVDLGIKTAVVPSHGEPLEGPKPLKKALARLKRANRKLHRRVKGSKNREKARNELARLHEKVANVRKDFWNKTTTRLCRENQTVVIEDLNVVWMIRNRSLSRAASDVALGMFRPRMAYKSQQYGTQLVVADRMFPSTQRCSTCGDRRSGDDRLTLSEREYVCLACGVVEDRDLNAAKNLEQYPWLKGNWDRKIQTPMDDLTSTGAPLAPASRVVEVGTETVGTQRGPQPREQGDLYKGDSRSDERKAITTLLARAKKLP